MRLRTLKPGFFQNDELGALPMAARLLFAGLWCYSDREGRFEWRPKRIKVAILPYDEVDIGGLLTALQEGGFIAQYGQGGAYGRVLRFKEHQRPHVHEQESTLPAPTGLVASTTKDVLEQHQGDCQDAQSLGSCLLSSVNNTEPDGSGVSEETRPRKNGKAFEPKHERTRELCAAIDEGRRHWREDVSLKASSPASLREMDGLLLTDGRDPNRVLEVLEWVFLSAPGDYQPSNPESFDWRRVVKSGASLRRNFDSLSDQMRAAHEAHGSGRSR